MNRHDGVYKEHPRPGKTHHFANLLSHFRFIAMYTAVGAKGFRLHKWTMITAAARILLKGGAIVTESMFCAVVLMTVERDHL